MLLDLLYIIIIERNLLDLVIPPHLNKFFLNTFQSSMEKDGSPTADQFKSFGHQNFISSHIGDSLVAISGPDNGY